MRHVAVALALAIPLLVPVGAAAEEPALSDATGDVMLVLADGAAPPLPASSFEFTRASDLVSLTASETEETIALTVAFASLAGDPVFTASRASFGWDGGDFDLYLNYFSSTQFSDGARVFASLVKVERDEREFVAQLSARADAAAGTILTHIPKVYLATDEGRVPGRGDTIELRSVTTNTNVVGFSLVSARARDRMPDAEAKPALLTLERGDYALGHVILSATDRVRVSNGGATTFVFQATVTNTGETEDEFAIGLEDVPEGWNATTRSPIVVPPKEERVASILVSVPFAHDHGGYSSFNVTARSASDAGTHAKMRMGVLHTPIPQPAGHHSELYLHADLNDGGAFGPLATTIFPNANGWMNTVSDHADDGEHVTPDTVDDKNVWRIPLYPSLQIGLDFDVERLGELQGSILGRRSGESEVAATLLYLAAGDDDTTVLAESDPVPITLDVQTPAPFALTLVPTAESDYIPYRPDAYVWLEVSLGGALLENARLSSIDPQLMVEDFRLALPLNEYHDRLTGLSEAAESLEIVARGPVEKTGLPGSVLTYPFTIRNGGPQDVFVIDLAGNHAHDGVVVPRGYVSLATGEEREVTLAVEVPVGSNEGQELEVLLFVHGRDDPTKMAIARTKTKVTHDAAEAHSDEASLLLDAQAREANVPAPSPLLVLGALLVLALARRRLAG